MDELIKRTQGIKVMSLSRTTAWRRERDDPSFPRLLKVGPRSFCYRVADIQKWIDSRPRRDVAKAEPVSDEAAESEAA